MEYDRGRLKNGLYTSKKGNLTIETLYTEGEKDGEEICYDETGKPVYECLYKAGKLRKKMCYDKKAKPSIKYECNIDEDFSWVEKYIFINGNLKEYYDEYYSYDKNDNFIWKQKIYCKEKEEEFYSKKIDFEVHYLNGNLKEKGYYDEVENAHLTGKYLFYYENGKLKEKSYLKIDERYGEYLEYYENGNLKEKSHFKDGIYDGECLRYYENGNLKEKCFYQYNIVNWPLFDYYLEYRNQKYNEFRHLSYEKLSSSHFNRSEIDDYTNRFVSWDSDRRSRSEYIVSELEKEYLSYYENGNLKEKSFYNNGVYNGECLRYYEKGSLKEKIYYEKGKAHGLDIIYNEDGSINSVKIYMYGNLVKEYNSLVKIEFSDKNNKEKTTYINGVKQGVTIYESDDTKKEYFYIDGVKQGKAISFSKVGREEFVYKDDIKQGEASYHYNDGSIEYYNYVDGVKQGKASYHYYSNNILFKGNVEEYYNYVDGIKQGEATILVKDFSKYKIKFNYINGLKQGKALITSNLYESLYTEYNYKNDKKNGEFLGYCSSGISERGYFIDDKPTKVEFFQYGLDKKVREKIYDENGKVKTAIEYIKDGSRMELTKENGTHYYINEDKEEFSYKFKYDDNMDTYSRYEDIIKDGTAIYYHSNGDKEVYLYKDNVKDGKGILYDKDGNIKEEITYSPKVEKISSSNDNEDDDGYDFSLAIKVGKLIGKTAFSAVKKIVEDCYEKNGGIK